MAGIPAFLTSLRAHQLTTPSGCNCWWLGSDGKVSVCDSGDLALIPGLGRSPGEGNGNSLPVLLPGKSHGWRSLVDYSPWGRKESDTTEQLHFQMTSLLIDIVGNFPFLLTIIGEEEFSDLLIIFSLPPLSGWNTLSHICSHAQAL